MLRKYLKSEFLYRCVWSEREFDKLYFDGLENLLVKQIERLLKNQLLSVIQRSVND